MNRREFLKAGAAATAVSAIVSPSPSLAADPATPHAAATSSPAVLSTYAAEDHRRRLQNISLCERGVWKAMREVKDGQLYTADANVVDMGYVYDVREFPLSRRASRSAGHRPRRRRTSRKQTAADRQASWLRLFRRLTCSG